MITVKSTKGPVETGDPAAPYVQKPAERKGGLVKAGAWLIAVAVYLKAVLSGKAAESQPSTESPPENPADALPEDVVNAPSLSVIPGGKPQPSGRRETADGDAGTMASQVTFALGSQSDTIAFPSVAQKPISPVFKPAAYVRSEANENASPAGGTMPQGQGGGLTARVAAQPVQTPSGRSDVGETPEASPGEGDGDDGEDPKSTNRAPRVTGPVQLNDIAGCGVLAIGLAELLRGATDPDGDALHVSDLAASSGSLAKRSDGTWEFASGGEAGPVTISYRISDGSLSIDQTLQFAVKSTQDVVGTDGGDILLGTTCADRIDAGAGNDLVEGRTGDDVIRGGAGNDRIVAGAGDDRVRGGAGDDVIFGGLGDDVLEGGAGNDRLFGDAGDDRLHGGLGDDMLHGGADDDHLWGGDGGDLLRGESGDDILDAGPGQDVVLGGAGDDTIIASADGVEDHYDGGDGCDALDYSAVASDIEVDLVAGCATGVEIGADTITGFERILTGAGNDLIRFGGNSVSMSGGEGRNAFEFKASALQPEAGGASLHQVNFEIGDFKVGDQLRLSKWDIFDEVLEDLEDDFERLYGDRSDEDHVPIRYRNEMSEEMSETIIEADLDGDDFYEIAILLNGRHALVFHETV